MKFKRITGLLALLMLSTAGYAQSTDLTPNGDGTWTLAVMPDYDVGLQVEYEDDFRIRWSRIGKVIPLIER